MGKCRVSLTTIAGGFNPVAYAANMSYLPLSKCAHVQNISIVIGFMSIIIKMLVRQRLPKLSSWQPIGEPHKFIKV